MDCPQCKQTLVGHPQLKQFFCIKCDLPCKVMTDDEEMEIVDIVDTTTKYSDDVDERNVIEEAEFDNMVLRNERRKKDDERSKKMGELLLQGWAMLADVCGKCLVPYMRSKKGEVLCVGCGPVTNTQNAPKSSIPKMETSKREEIKMEKTPETIKKEEPKPVTQIKEEPKKQPQQIHQEKISEPIKEVPKEKKVEKVIFKQQEMIQESLGLYSSITAALIKEVNRVSNSETGDSLLAHLEKIAKLQSSVDTMKRNLKS